MPLTFPSSPTISQEYTDSNGMIWRYNGFAWEPYLGSYTRGFIGAKVKLASPINLTATEAIISFQTEEIDVGSIFSTNRFTVKETGYYRINANIYTGNNGAGNSYTVTIKKNGSEVIDTELLGSNQSGVYDSILFFAKGDYVEVFASESTASGTLTTDTRVGFYFVGSSPGTSTFSNSNLFSGVKVELVAPENLTNTNTKIQWDSVEYNVNADSTGNVYWTSGQSSNVKIYTTGYYRVQFLVEAGASGTTNGYVVNFKKNSTLLETGTLSPNDKADYDTVLYLSSGDVLNIEAAESDSAGTITTNSFLTVSRVGV